MINVYRLCKISCNDHKTVFSHVISPFYDFGNSATGTFDCPGLLEKRYPNILLLPCHRVRSGNRSCLSWKVFYQQSVVLKRIRVRIHTQWKIVVHLITNLNQTFSKPVPKTILIKHGHSDVNIRFKLKKSFTIIRNGTRPNSFKSYTVLTLKRLRKSLKILSIHRHTICMTGMINHLGHFPYHPVFRPRPKPLHGFTDYYHRTTIILIPIFHGLQSADDLIIICGIINLKHIPSI